MCYTSHQTYSCTHRIRGTQRRFLCGKGVCLEPFTITQQTAQHECPACERYYQSQLPSYSFDDLNSDEFDAWYRDVREHANRDVREPRMRVGGLFSHAESAARQTNNRGRRPAISAPSPAQNAHDAVAAAMEDLTATLDGLFQAGLIDARSASQGLATEALLDPVLRGETRPLRRSRPQPEPQILIPGDILLSSPLPSATGGNLSQASGPGSAFFGPPNTPVTNGGFSQPQESQLFGSAAPQGEASEIAPETEVEELLRSCTQQ